MLNLKEMLVGYPVRLRYVDRFSTSRVMKKETVAEHSFFVAFYSLMIAQWTIASKQLASIDIATILAKALVHDIDEAATGDVPRGFKYSEPGLKEHLDEVAAKGVKMIAKKLWQNNQFVNEMVANWKSAKNDTPEGRILEFADFLSVLSYVYEEIRSSNFTIKEHLVAMTAYYEKFKAPEYNFLRPLIEDARAILLEEVLLDVS